MLGTAILTLLAHKLLFVPTVASITVSASFKVSPLEPEEINPTASVPLRRASPRSGKGLEAVYLPLAPSPFGPVASVMGRLTSAEKDEFQAIFESNANLTMGQLEKVVERFVTSLPNDTQSAFEAAKSEYDAKISEAVKKSANLSSDAHALVGMISTVINDNKVTWPQMSNIVRLLHENASKRVLDELREAEIPFPLGPLPLPQAVEKANV